ncbi:MAG: HEAT repeat domain-containing protein [Motiliproteus sp.]|nr:HEAT repeat domain-containing protein [Motiliproteus sp.]MCW9051861.1 HEAT repeat domain-containing protein [Motiliproteus sp.]
MTGRNDVVDALIKLLENGDEADRCYAAQTLGKLADKDAIQALIERLQDEDIDVCIDAIYALGAIGDSRATSALVESLFKDPEGEVKVAATEALGQIGDQEGAAVLIQIAQQRPDGLEMDDDDNWDDYWDIQLKAVQALSQIDTTNTATALCSILDNDELQDIESEVLTALSQGDSQCLEALISRSIEATPRSRRRAIKALGRNSSDSAKQSVLNALKDNDADIRSEAISALVRMQATDQLNTIFNCLKDPVADVRAEALRGLVQLARVHGANNFGPELLIPLLDTEDSLVKGTILEALRDKIETTSADLDEALLPTLLASLKSDNYDEAVAACALLSHIHSRDVRTELVQLMLDEDYDGRLRQQAVRSLGQQQCRELEAIMALLQVVKDKNPALRVAAIESLYGLQQLPAPEMDEEQIQLDEPLKLLLSLMHNGDPLEELEQALRAKEIAEAEAKIEAEQIAEPAANDNQQLIDAVQLDGAADTGMAAALKAIHDENDNQAPDTDTSSELTVPSDYSDLETESEFSAGSTLDAITMDNFEVMTESKNDAPDDERLLNMVDEMPDEMQGFGDVVRDHLETGDRVFATKKRKPVAEDVRLLVIRSLADSEDPEVIESLILALSDSDMDVCREAALALGLIAERNHQAEGISNAFGALVTQLQFNNQDLRLACLRALGSLQHKEGIVPVLDSLQDPISGVRIEAINALLSLAKSDYSDDPNSHHMVLEEFSDREVIAAIRPLLEDSEEGVRKAAVEALAELQDSDSLDQIIDAGLCNHGALATPVARALKVMDIGEITSKLLLRLASLPESSQRRFVIKMLETLFRAQKTTAAV